MSYVRSAADSRSLSSCASPSAIVPSASSRASFFFFSSRRRHTRCLSDWSSDVCSSDLDPLNLDEPAEALDQHKGRNRRGDHRGYHRAGRGGKPNAPVDERLVPHGEAESEEHRRKAEDGDEPPPERLPLQEERDEIGRASCRERG